MPAQKALVTNSVAFQWSDGTLFNGYLLLLMTTPTANNGTYWTTVVLNDNAQRIRVPTAVKLPIRDGYFEPDAYIWRTDSLTPPKCQYSCFYYDSTDRLILVEGNLFSSVDSEEDITTNAFTIPVFGSPSTFPTPEQVPSNTPTIETPTGTVNGINAVFQLSRSTYNQVQLLFNATFPLLAGGVDYTIAGGIITMITHIPTTNDNFKAFIF